MSLSQLEKSLPLDKDTRTKAVREIAVGNQARSFCNTDIKLFGKDFEVH